MDTLCCSDTCEKRTECARHSINNEGLHYVENFESYGSGYMTNNGYEIDHWCGKLGDYKMFEPIKNSCSGCVYEGADGSTSAISNCICCSRNFDLARKDNYRKRIKT